MSDAEQLFWVLAAIYVAVSAIWMRPATAALVTDWGRAWRVRTAGGSAVLQSDAGGLLFTHLTPWGRSAVGRAWPLAISPDGFVAGPAAVPDPDPLPGPAPYVAFADVESVSSEGAVVKVNGVSLIRIGSASYAAVLARLLTKLAGLPAAERQAAIDAAVVRSLDDAEVTERARTVARRTAFLATLGTALFVFAFGSLAMAAFLDRPIVSLRGGLAVYAALVTTCAVAFVRAHRAVRAAEPGERWRHAAVMLAAPAEAMLAAGWLLRKTVELFHPLALAAALAPRPTFLDYARRVVLDLRHPRPDVAADPAAARTSDWFRGRLHAGVVELLGRQGVDVDELLSPPGAESAACVAYCPRCRGQYERPTGRCNSCRVELTPIDRPACAGGR